jgi:hypothetical protein
MRFPGFFLMLYKNFLCLIDILFHFVLEFCYIQVRFIIIKPVSYPATNYGQWLTLYEYQLIV